MRIKYHWSAFKFWLSLIRFDPYFSGPKWHQIGFIGPLMALKIVMITRYGK